MAIQAHLVELERKHRVLESELHEALLHLSTDDLQIAELKRRKLMVKDQIERLKNAAGETVH
ncbi:MAG: YdcH family protein [Bradyrhizobium sp.]